jgi:hypothetical protein
VKRMNWLAAVCLVASVARAEGNAVRKLTIELDWHHVPRAGGDDAPVSSQRALVPNAAVRYQRFKDGLRMFSIQFDDDVECATYAEKPSIVFLTCGTRRAYYTLSQLPGTQAKLEWVTIGSQPTQVVQQ